MLVKAFINGTLYKTYDVPSTDGTWDARSINMSLLEDRKMGLLAGYEPIHEIKLEPQR